MRDESFEPTYLAGDRVEKVTGDYEFKGTVLCTFLKLSGVRRYVVENGDGIVHIFSQGNLRFQDPTERNVTTPQ